MTFSEKNIMVSMINFIVILGFFLFRLMRLRQLDSFDADSLFRTWGIVIFLAIVVTIFATIMTHIVLHIVESIKTGEKQPELDQLTDERDQIIDLKGTKVTYSITSVGSFVAMLTFVFGYSPLVMFSLLIFFGVLAQIIGDASRLMLYRTGI